MKKDGGPVFPPIIFGCTDGKGISVRDYFAAHAPTGDPVVLGSWVDAEQQRAIYSACAESAYMWADEMIRAREKQS